LGSQLGHEKAAAILGDAAIIVLSAILPTQPLFLVFMKTRM
jgi:hypothetical protein